jgi:uncharacterized protein
VKYLVLLAVLMAAIWWIKRQRLPQAPTPKNATPEPQPMVACAHCGLHLPQSEAVASDRAFYCSPSHRALAEG